MRLAQSLLSELCARLHVDEKQLTIHEHQSAVAWVARELANHRKTMG